MGSAPPRQPQDAKLSPPLIAGDLHCHQNGWHREGRFAAVTRPSVAPASEGNGPQELRPRWAPQDATGRRQLSVLVPLHNTPSDTPPPLVSHLSLCQNYMCPRRSLPSPRRTQAAAICQHTHSHPSKAQTHPSPFLLGSPRCCWRGGSWGQQAATHFPSPTSDLHIRPAGHRGTVWLHGSMPQAAPALRLECPKHSTTSSGQSCGHLLWASFILAGRKWLQGSLAGLWAQLQGAPTHTAQPCCICVLRRKQTRSQAICVPEIKRKGHFTTMQIHA